MKPSTFQDGVRLQFDCLVKRVIDTTVKDYQKELGRRAKHEITFSDVSEMWCYVKKKYKLKATNFLSLTGNFTYSFF